MPCPPSIDGYDAVALRRGQNAILSYDLLKTDLTQHELDVLRLSIGFAMALGGRKFSTFSDFLGKKFEPKGRFSGTMGYNEHMFIILSASGER